MDSFGGARQFGLGQPIFLLGVVRGRDFHRAQGDHLRAGDYAYFLSLGRSGQPGAEILPRRCNRQGFHAAA
jgi:hypothetical protein